MGEARRASVRGLSTDRQELNLIPRKAPSRLTNRLVRTRMLGGVRGRGLAAPSYSIKVGFFFNGPKETVRGSHPALAKPNRRNNRRGKTASGSSPSRKGRLAHSG